VVGVGVGLDEDCGDADGDGGTGEGGDELALTAGGRALASGLLDGVGGVEDDGCAGAAMMGRERMSETRVL